ncbi:MAG: hypothetical protein CSA49_05240 [Gammaproteobacteria bacterium]|nr:MAG: hypothetical protein CSA49_05240 [Gammaproteobacteria bacterium]
MKKLTDFLTLNGRFSLNTPGSKVKGVAEQNSERLQKDYLLLFQLMRDHRMLRLRVQGDTHTYQTMLLEVNTDEGYLLIDEPFPFDGILNGDFRQNVVLEYEREGFTTVISSVVEMRIEEGSDKYFRLEWPKIEEQQRRKQYRLPMTQHWKNSASLSGLVDQQANAILDLSSSGIRIAFEGDQMETVYAGACLEDVCLHLQGCEPMVLTLDITHCHYDLNVDTGKVQTTVAGARFVGLDYQEHQAIQRFILSVQRIARRRELDQQVMAA